MAQPSSFILARRALLGWARLGELERAGAHRPRRAIAGDDHAVVESGWRPGPARRLGRVAEQFLAAAEQDREDEEVELVDQAGREQRLDQHGAALGQQIRPVALLEPGDRRRHVAFEPHAIGPVERRGGGGGDIFGDGVEQAGRLLFGERPMGGENLPGLATEQQVERPREALAQRLAHHFVPIGAGPPAEAETAGRILLGSARCLHHAVQADESGADDPPHRASSAATSPSWSAQVPQPSWKPILEWVVGGRPVGGASPPRDRASCRRRRPRG
jgi:hypothetical protein